MSNKIKLTVDNMTCQHCVRAITQAIQSMDPQAIVDVQLAQKQVTIQSTLSTAQIIDALAEEGYTTKLD